MRILKSNPLFKLANSYLIDASQPINISYAWNFGSLLAVCLIIQIITGVTLAMHYSPSVLEAFNTIEHIMRDVNNGWFVRYLHANTASAFFLLVYLHVGRGMYYASFKTPRVLVWIIGTVILIMMIVIGFLGYVLPFGQMSLWGATVITNLISAIPWIGTDVVEFIWGGFSVNNATLNRFFSLHFLLPFVLAALVLMHLIALHDGAGSSNPVGASGNYDRLPFSPYFLFKDLVTIFMAFIALCLFVFFIPNLLGDSENYVMANPMQTPAAIVPEWYLLTFYAVLRSIPNKLLGVIAMFSAILAIMLLPISDLGKSKGLQFKVLTKIILVIFVANFLELMTLGAKHVESPYIQFGLITTALYFAYFILIVPTFNFLENVFLNLNLSKNFNFILSSFKLILGGNRSFSSTKSLKIPPFFFLPEVPAFGDITKPSRGGHYVYRTIRDGIGRPTLGVWAPSKDGTCWMWYLRDHSNRIVTFNPFYQTDTPGQIFAGRMMSLGADSTPPTAFEIARAKFMSPTGSNPLVGPGFTANIPGIPTAYSDGAWYCSAPRDMVQHGFPGAGRMNYPGNPNGFSYHQVANPGNTLGKFSGGITLERPASYLSGGSSRVPPSFVSADSFQTTIPGSPAFANKPPIGNPNQWRDRLIPVDFLKPDTSIPSSSPASLDIPSVNQPGSGFRPIRPRPAPSRSNGRTTSAMVGTSQVSSSENKGGRNNENGRSNGGPTNSGPGSSNSSGGYTGTGNYGFGGNSGGSVNQRSSNIMFDGLLSLVLLLIAIGTLYILISCYSLFLFNFFKIVKFFGVLLKIITSLFYF